MINWWKADAIGARARQVATPAPERASLVEGYPPSWQEGWYFGWRKAAELSRVSDPLQKWRLKTRVPGSPEYVKGIRQVAAELDALLRPGQTVLWVRRSPELLDFLERMGLPRKRLQDAASWEPYCLEVRYPFLTWGERTFLEGVPSEDFAFSGEGSMP